MSALGQPAIASLLLACIDRFFLVFGVVGFAVGVGLVLNHARMHQLFTTTDRWVSMRRSTKWLSVPRDIEADVRHYPRFIGGIFMLLAAFSTFVLTVQFNVAGVVNALDVAAPYSYVAWLVECLRWALVAGGVVAIAVGAMLIFWPAALRSIETYSDRWYSFRAHNKIGDTMHLGFDQWVESYPRVFGVVIALAAIVVVVEYALRLFARN
jgi:hypothetical protein